MQTLTQEIKDQLELYVQYDSTVDLNQFNTSVVHQAIYALNYVNDVFIRDHIDVKPFELTVAYGGLLEVSASESDYITIKRADSPLVIYHDAEATKINIDDTRVNGELGCDDEEFEMVTDSLIKLIASINDSYTAGINAKLKAL